MAIDTGNKALNSLLNEQLMLLASKNAPQGNLLSAVARVREAVFHDFSNYSFLLPPHYTRQPGDIAYPGVGATADGTDVLGQPSCH